jgi:hypothetical protein
VLEVGRVERPTNIPLTGMNEKLIESAQAKRKKRSVPIILHILQ